MEMLNWQYLEAQLLDQPGESVLLVFQDYAEKYEYTKPTYKLSELGDMGWNLIMVITNLGVFKDQIRYVFKRPTSRAST